MTPSIPSYGPAVIRTGFPSAKSPWFMYPVYPDYLEKANRHYLVRHPNYSLYHMKSAYYCGSAVCEEKSLKKVLTALQQRRSV